MKFIKSRNQFEASNVSFNVLTEVALSYNWWIFVKRINGKLVFNNYGYSVSTRKHQSKVRNLLNKLGKTIDLVIEAPRGLDNLENAKEHYQFLISELIRETKKKGTKKAKNEERLMQVERYKACIKELDSLIYETPLEEALS